MPLAHHTLGPLQTDPTSGLAFRLRHPLPARPTRCLVLLHGVGGNETNLLELADGVDAETLVVFPQGRLPLGPQQFAWFRVAFTANGPSIVAQEAEDSRLALIHFVEQLQASYAIAPNRTVVAGFSQGGIMSASVALTAPQHVAGFGLLSGRILPELEPVLARKDQLTQLKGFIGHGEHDSKLPVSWAHKADLLLKDLGVQHTLHLYPMDHGISATMHTDFVAWLHTLEEGNPT
ncbi:MAG: phospholipase [Rhodoferax sp.]